MKKVIYNKYGGADVLEIIETAMPVINENQVLIRVSLCNSTAKSESDSRRIF